MDRIIKKKRWTIKKIVTIITIAAFSFLLIYLIFIRDNTSRLYVDRNQLTISTVIVDKFQEFIPIDGIVFPKTTFSCFRHFFIKTLLLL
jgi:HlyD family secretion protein